MQTENAAIKPRDFRFARAAEALAEDWNGKDAFRTAFFNAMSILFPEGEKSFIDSVLAHQDRITDPKLKADVRGFTAQESVHRREHLRFNQELCRARGYDLAHLEKSVKDSSAADLNLPPLTWLASTVAYEHLTATIAHGILTESSWFEGADRAIADMWRWHAIEEIEHKCVAFDVYMAAGGSRSELRKVLLLVTWEFWLRYIGPHIRYMLARSGAARWPAFRSGMRFLFGRRGLLRTCWRQYWMFFAAHFHPSNIDERALVAGALRRLEAAGPGVSYGIGAALGPSSA